MLMLSLVEKSCPFTLGKNSSCTLVVTPIFGCCFFFHGSSCCNSSIQLAVRRQAEVWPLLTDMRFVFRTCCWGFEFIYCGWFQWSNLQTLDHYGGRELILMYSMHVCKKIYSLSSLFCTQEWICMWESCFQNLLPWCQTVKKSCWLMATC